MADSEDRIDPEVEGGQDAPLGKRAAKDVAVVAKGGAVQIAGQLSQRGFSTLFLAVATRIIGTAGYGLYSLVSRVLSLAGQLGLVGFNYSAMRYIARARARKDPGGVRGAARTAMVGTGIASLLVVAAVLIAANPIAELFADKDTDPSVVADYVRLGVLFIPLFAFLQVLRYCTQAYKTMVPSVIAGNLVQPAARFVIGVTALAVGLEVAGAIGSLVISMGIGMLVAGWLFRRILTEGERAARPKARVGEMVRFSFLQAGASLLGIQALGLGILIVGIAAPDEQAHFQAGLFTIALSLQGPGTVFLGGIVNIWAPVVSDLYERNALDRLESLYQTITRWVATFSFPVFAALILEPDLFARILAPGKDVNELAPVIAILAIGNIFYTGTGPTGYVLSMTGRPGLNFINSVIAVCLYIGLGFVVVPDHGAIGMAWVDTGVTAVINSIRVVQARIVVGVQPFGRSFFKPVAATLAGAAVLLTWRLIPGNSIPLEIGGVVVASIVYLVVLRVFGMDAEERHVWEQVKKRLPSRRGSDK